MQTVLDTWKAYFAAGGRGSATELGIQLIKHSEQLDEMRVEWEREGENPGEQHAARQQERAMSFDSLAGILVGRLERFVFLEAKPRLKEAGLDNADDFGLLAALFFKPYISKGQLLKQSLIEPATGTEMLKRMKKAGWIEEKPNPVDGRSVLVALTAEGRALTGRCFLHLRKIENTLDTLTTQEKVFLVSVLEKLDHCHSGRHGIKTIGNWIRESNFQVNGTGN